jgi:hypothetical protein
MERCRSALTSEFSAAATLLREDIAQVLGFVLVQLAAVQQQLPAPVVQQDLDELRQVVRVELGRVLELAQTLSSPSTATV